VAAPVAEESAPSTKPKDIDDPARLADEARENVSKAASDLRAQRVAIDTEPPTQFRPDRT